MNNGILTQSAQPVAMPYGLLGRPTPVPMPAGDYAFDVDAADYIRRVEAADGRALELPVRLALDAFVRGCKDDGIWNAIKASCILAGARTLAGALVPLVGTAPTNFNFVNSDYNRKSGLKGDASTKYLNSNRNNASDPQNSRHMATYVTAAINNSAQFLMTGGVYANRGNSSLFHASGGTYGGRISVVENSVGFNTGIVSPYTPNFLGIVRNASNSQQLRVGKLTYTNAEQSSTPFNTSILVFSGPNLDVPTSSTLSFYSIGEALDLALLDGRVTTLMNTLAAVL